MLFIVVVIEVLEAVKDLSKEEIGRKLVASEAERKTKYSLKTSTALKAIPNS